MKKLLLPILILVIIFMSGLFKKSTKYEILETRDFSCPGMSSFTFKYPVFKDWEVRSIESKNPGRCSIFFNWPNVIKYEIAPQITIEKLPELGQNPVGIPYEYITDPSQYVKDHVFQKGDWDWLVFYGKDFGVRISRNLFGILPDNEEVKKQKLHEFDAEIFYKTVIETFRFTPD